MEKSPVHFDVPQVERPEGESRPENYFEPRDEFDTEKFWEFLEFAKEKALAQAEEEVPREGFGTKEEHEVAVEDRAEKERHFPVIFVMAPHVTHDTGAGFAGEPTSLMNATSVLNRYVETDTFPALKTPEVVSMHNPTEWSPEFVANFIEEIKEEQPRVVGISNTSEGHYFALQIAKIVKMYSPETMVVLGGAHEDGTSFASYFEESFATRHDLAPEQKERLKFAHTLSDEEARKSVDVVVAGDGQYALPEVLKLVGNSEGMTNQEIVEQMAAHPDLWRDIEGSGHVYVYDRQKEDVVAMPLAGTPLDWNELPHMFRGQLAQENAAELFGGKKMANVMTRPGCVNACDFCQESLSGDMYSLGRGRAPENVMAELKELRKQKYQAVFFDDSTFGQNPRQTSELLDQMIAERAKSRGLKLEWGCQSTFESIRSKQFLAKMKEAGCTYVYFGIEELGVQAGEGAKAVDAKKAEQVLRWCQDLGIRTGLSLQFGLGEDGSAEATVDYVAGLQEEGLVADGCVALNVNTPYPGTKQWLEMAKEGKIPDFSDPMYRHPRFESAHQLGSLTLDEVNTVWAYARERLGKALRGVSFSSQEIETHLGQYQSHEGDDFYFDTETYERYLTGKMKGLHLNHASLTRPCLPAEREASRVMEQGADAAEKEKIFSQARAQAAELVGVDERGVAFGRNGTEALSYCFCLAGLKEEDRVLLTDAENHSVGRAFEVHMDHGNPEGEDKWSAYPTSYRMRGRGYDGVSPELTGVQTATIEVVRADDEEIFSNIEDALKKNTKCFVISHVIRDTGRELKIKEICDFVRAKKAEKNPEDPEIFIVVDGAQALGNLPKVDFGELGCDAYLATPHKTMSSTPLGVLYFDPENPLLKENLAKMNGLHYQDEQILLDGAFHPQLGIEPNVDDEIEAADVAGFNAAIDFLKKMGLQEGDFSEINERRQELKEHFMTKLHEVVFELSMGVPYEIDQNTDFISGFSIPGIDNRELAKRLGDKGVFLSYIDRTKLQDDMEETTSGNGIVRVSFGATNYETEIDDFMPAFRDVLYDLRAEAVANFEDVADDALLRGHSGFMGWIAKQAASPISKISLAAASVVLTLQMMRWDKAARWERIPVDETFVAAQAEEASIKAGIVTRNEDEWNNTSKEEKQKWSMWKFKYHTDWHFVEVGLRAKHTFLANLNDPEVIEKIFQEENDWGMSSEWHIVNARYTALEREAIRTAYRYTKDERIGKVVAEIEKAEARGVEPLDQTKAWFVADKQKEAEEHRARAARYRQRIKEDFSEDDTSVSKWRMWESSSMEELKMHRSLLLASVYDPQEVKKALAEGATLHLLWTFDYDPMERRAIMEAHRMHGGLGPVVTAIMERDQRDKEKEAPANPDAQDKESWRQPGGREERRKADTSNDIPNETASA